MSCPFVDTCRAFQAIQGDPGKQYLAWAFCWGEHTDCGRYKSTLAGRAIPDGMLPTGEIAEVLAPKQARRID
jgi:hypothetical protein